MAENTITTPFYCAIYTRKSTSEGLDQEFTSLDNQRESAESYINSQKNEGWIALPDLYDDGGYTGANTERPALQKLIADIKEGKINCVVVYKVDRLSRSLLDFVQLLELFEKYHVAFVSVTQAFNTNNSMGRLTLNILLSFAQFEREIISERVRDKMGAARKKGRYIGGIPMLGYDIDRENHKIIVNKKESELVREIFDLYLKERSFLKVTIILNERGHRNKKFTSKTGKVFGDTKFKNNNVQSILKNIIYTGKVLYNGIAYSGMHEAIISDEVFNKAQEIIEYNRVERPDFKNKANPGLLNHLLRCKACNSIMFHTYTSKKGKLKYQYYVCMNAQKRGYKNCQTRSVNALQMENAVVASLAQIAADSEFRKKALENVNKLTREEIAAFEKKRKTLCKNARELHDKIDNLKEDLKNPNGNQEELERKLKSLAPKYEDYDRLLTDARVKEMALGQKLITDRELEEAFLIVKSPLWETLFPAQKHKVIKLMLKDIYFTAKDSKIELTLNHGGIKFLYLLLHPELQKKLS